MDEERFFKGCAISTLAVLILAGVCFLFGFLSGRESAQRAWTGEDVKRDTVYLPATPVQDDINLTSSEAAGEVVATLPVASAAEVPQPPSADSLEVAAIPETRDSATVVVPIERKTFEGEFYKATVEGYRASLLDMQLKVPTMLVTETKTATKRKLWSVTIGPQVGYGFTPAGWQPYAGVGITFGLSF